MKILYLMGAGHVGSTVIDVVIGAQPQIESLGEAWKLPTTWQTPETERPCACGALIRDCAFWRDVRRVWAEKVGDEDEGAYLAGMLRFQGGRSAWPRLLANRLRPGAAFRDYLRRNRALYEAVLQVGGKEMIVESSLSPRRALALASTPGIELYLVHVVRDGRGVIWSHRNPAKAKLRRSFRPAPTARITRYWISANLQSAYVSSCLPPERRMQLRYEDFAAAPHEALARIGEFVGEDLSEVLTSEGAIRQPAPVRHTPGGNRVRLLREVQVRPDAGWMEHLPDADRTLFWRRAGWLASRYGYEAEPA
jgi:hypothetical protein